MHTAKGAIFATQTIGMAEHFSITRRQVIYIIRILLGVTIVWWSLYFLHDERKLWALVSVIIVSEPDFELVRSSTLARMINTIVGCVIGLFFTYVTGASFWSLAAGIAAAVLVSTSFKKYPASWKLAPVTVVIVMSPILLEHISLRNDTLIALTRTGEVLYGSLVALALGGLFHLIEHRWLPEPAKQTDTANVPDDKRI